MSTVTYTTITEIEIDLDVDIFFLNSRVFTTTDISKIDVPYGKEKGKKYLCISIEIQVEFDFSSAMDVVAYARPRLLIIFGILSFLIQEIFTPFEFYLYFIAKTPLTRSDSTKFEFNKSNYLPDVKTLIEFINSKSENERRLFYSLIDRYRKALYLEKESEENMIHDDEILLSHFHILELLSNKYYPQQKKLALQSINQFTETILKNIYLIEDQQLQAVLNEKRKLVESLFISEFSVGSKIMYMFQQQGILTKRLKSFISDLIKDRNCVAHGRQVYQEKVIFPVPPFFPLIRNREYSFEMLRLLSGRAISLFININHLKEEWNEIDATLMPTFDELKIFINEKKFETITINDFYSGKENDITPFTLSYYMLNKRLTAEEVIPVLSSIILNYREIKNEIEQIILAVILIVDNSKNELKEKCTDIIKLSDKNGWFPDSKMRDILYYLEYLGHQPKTLKEMIAKREIR